jgi:hypothetical protein
MRVRCCRLHVAPGDRCASPSVHVLAEAPCGLLGPGSPFTVPYPRGPSATRTTAYVGMGPRGLPVLACAWDGGVGGGGGGRVAPCCAAPPPTLCGRYLNPAFVTRRRRTSCTPLWIA